MDLQQIVYSSQPFGYDSASLMQILNDARFCNARDGVTGALVCRHDIFLQILEGPKDAIDRTLERIRQDDRHLNVTLHVSAPVSGRMFGDWAMLHDPARSWLWPPDRIVDGTPQDVTPEEILGVFSRLAADVMPRPSG